MKHGADPDRPDQSSPAAPVRVMVVEDSAEIRQRLVRMLSELDGVHVVGEAQGAVEATERALALQPDLLTLDLELGDGSGFAVLQSVRAFASPPVVAVLTNHASRQVRERCLSAGADFFFDKSHELDALAGAVARLVAAPEDD